MYIFFLKDIIVFFVKSGYKTKRVITNGISNPIKIQSTEYFLKSGITML